MGKHTKGPWRYDPERRWVESLGTAPCMARVALVDDSAGCYPMGNGLLIAAAPKMYEALKEVIDAWQYGESTTVARDVYERAIAAIAKAEGE